ncbi:hypothetical protein K1719_020772 [Acacia pycnantha]|nr:hypothetical protein K1719_020772 [Acacia pycnantha]
MKKEQEEEHTQKFRGSLLYYYRAVRCKSLLVSNDEMRDHLFQPLGSSIFPRWKEKHQGLGLIHGTVGRFDSSNGFRVLHIGWNALQVTMDVRNRQVFFVHSNRAMPSDKHKEWVSSKCACCSVPS